MSFNNIALDFDETEHKYFNGNRVQTTAQWKIKEEHGERWDRHWPRPMNRADSDRLLRSEGRSGIL